MLRWDRSYLEPFERARAEIEFVSGLLVGGAPKARRVIDAGGVPSGGLDSWSDPLVVEVLDGVPSGMWGLCQGVFDNVGPYDNWVEHPAVGLMPAEACAEDTSKHVS